VLGIIDFDGGIDAEHEGNDLDLGVGAPDYEIDFLPELDGVVDALERVGLGVVFLPAACSGGSLDDRLRTSG